MVIVEVLPFTILDCVSFKQNTEFICYIKVDFHIPFSFQTESIIQQLKINF